MFDPDVRSGASTRRSSFMSQATHTTKKQHVGPLFYPHTQRPAKRSKQAPSQPKASPHETASKATPRNPSPHTHLIPNFDELQFEKTTVDPNKG